MAEAAHFQLQACCGEGVAARSCAPGPRAPQQLPRIFTGGATPDASRGFHAKHTPRRPLNAQAQGSLTARLVRTGTGKRVFPSATPQWIPDQDAFRAGRDLGAEAYGEDYAATFRTAAGAKSGELEYQRSIRTHRNHQRSLIDPVVFGQNPGYSREALFGKHFDPSAAGKPLIAGQPELPRSPRSRFRETGPLDSQHPERQRGGQPAGLATTAAVLGRRRAWE